MDRMNNASRRDSVHFERNPQKNDFYNRYFKGDFSSLPKYLQLREVLLAAIMDGYWGSKEKLPPEAVLTQMTPYSLGTVQKALGLLAEEGIIVRRHGYGTYVVENLISPRHCRLVGNDITHVLPIYPQLVAKKLTEGEEPWAAHLGAQGKNIVTLERVLDVNHELLVFNRFQINQYKYPAFWELPEKELTGINFKHVLQNRYNTIITMTSNYIRQSLFPKAICQHLRMSDNVFGLHLEVMARNSRGEPVYFYDLYIPPTKHRLHISDFQGLDI